MSQNNQWEQNGFGQVEKWFRKRGLPHFVKNYSSTSNVLTRALPVLVFWFFISAVFAIDLNWVWWHMVLVILAGIVLLAVVWVVVNKIRNREVLEVPRKIGILEVSVFLIIPSILPLIFGFDWAGAGITLVVQVSVLAVVFIFTSFGMLDIFMWGLGKLWQTISQTFRLFTKSLPLLLIGFMFLFINQDTWQTAGKLSPVLLFGAVILLLTLAGVFLGAQLPKEIYKPNMFSSWAEVASLAQNGPIAFESEQNQTLKPQNLSRKEKYNLWLVVFITQAFRLVLVSLLIGVFFIILGMFMAQPDTTGVWVGQTSNILWSSPWEISGSGLQITSELLQVVLFLASFAALYFSVYVATEPNLHQEFFSDTIVEMKQSLAVRAIYYKKVENR